MRWARGTHFYAHFIWFYTDKLREIKFTDRNQGLKEIFVFTECITPDLLDKNKKKNKKVLNLTQYYRGPKIYKL